MHSEQPSSILGRPLDLGQAPLEEGEDLGEALGHGPVDHGDVHGLVLPHVVVCDGGEAAVAEAELPCQLAFGDDGHADDVGELPEHVALGPGGEPGALDAQVGPASVVPDAHLLRGLGEDPVQVGAEGVGDGDVHRAVVEVGVVPPLGEVDELVRDDQVPRDELLLQGPDGAGRYDVLASELLQRPHVGPVGDVGRGVLVPLPVAVEERDLHTVDPSDEDGVRGLPVGCVGEDLLDGLEGVGVVDPRAADDCDFWHAPLSEGPYKGERIPVAAGRRRSLSVGWVVRPLVVCRLHRITRFLSSKGVCYHNCIGFSMWKNPSESSLDAEKWVQFSDDST